MRSFSSWCVIPCFLVALAIPFVSACSPGHAVSPQRDEIYAPAPQFSTIQMIEDPVLKTAARPPKTIQNEIDSLLAIHNDKGDSQTAKQLGDTYNELRRSTTSSAIVAKAIDGATKYYTIAARHPDHKDECEFKLAVLYFESSDSENAKKSLRKLLAADPKGQNSTTPYGFVYLGELYYQELNKNPASSQYSLASFEELLKLPNSPTELKALSYLRLAQIEAKIGHNDKSKEHAKNLRALADKDPQTFGIKELLSQLP